MPPEFFFLILDLKMSTSSAFSSFVFSYLMYKQKTLLLGLENLLLHANRQQKAGKQAC